MKFPWIVTRLFTGAPHWLDVRSVALQNTPVCAVQYVEASDGHVSATATSTARPRAEGIAGAIRGALPAKLQGILVGFDSPRLGEDRHGRRRRRDHACRECRRHREGRRRAHARYDRPLLEVERPAPRLVMRRLETKRPVTGWCRPNAMASKRGEGYRGPSSGPRASTISSPPKQRCYERSRFVWAESKRRQDQQS
jgi:hypothetical protein